ncbi:hypothetical protein BC835DRAFT_477664 [Cytidiella melzeri]|nr:hypothetical protein BC835DRAFT_477664 [Cytidiella melzeri]
MYKLNIECPVKWTATQEKSISRELPVSEISATSAAECVSRIYLQSLWLPESIMPLDRLIPALLLVAATPVLEPSSSRSQAYGLFELVKPHLLTPRLVTEKYQKRISALVDEAEHGEAGPDDELMWYVLRYEKGIHDDEDMSEEQQAAAYDSWKKTWLSHMEQREITIQLLLHFLLLTLPDIPRDEPKSRSTEVMVPSPSPRKRVRASSPTKGLLSVSILEQHLEFLMDRLAMWQLMSSIDPNAGGDVTVRQTHRLQSAYKKRHESVDDRDWMQILCEDIVEPFFRDKLPAQCSLLRSKVFQASPFDEDEDSLDFQDTSPVSPRSNLNRLKKTDSRAETRDSQKHDVSMTRSLTDTLEEERVRERSRSLSIGPNTMQKRALAREVSMSTAFKGKDKRLQERLGKRPAVGKSKNTADAGVAKVKNKNSTGTTLVAATPVKSKLKAGRSFASVYGEGKDKLPTIVDDSGIMSNGTGRRAVEGGDDDEDWMLQSSPDVLLLTDEDRSTSPGEPDEGAKGWSLFGNSRMLVEATPTKKRT